MELIITDARVVTMVPGSAGLADSMLVRDGAVAIVRRASKFILFNSFRQGLCS